MVILLLACAGAPDDAGRTDTSDTAEETGAVDTGDSADTHDTAPDTGDSGDTGDTGDTAAWVDADGDGSPDTEDCDDANPSIHPGAFDQCDTIDQDCDGSPIGPGACAEEGSLDAGARWLVSHPDDWEATAVMVGDVTGDALPDLLGMAGATYTVYPGGAVPPTPWESPEDGYHSLVDALPGVGVVEFEAGDVDGDGVEDLGVVSIYEDMGVHLFLGPFAAGDTTSMRSEHVYLDPGVRPDYMWGSPTYGAVDFDGDGRDDLIADNNDSPLAGTYSVYFGGEWDTVCLLGDTEYAYVRVYDDLDGDGLADALLSGTTTGLVSGADLRSSCGTPIDDLVFAWLNPDDRWVSPTTIRDWNGDGWVDLAVADSQSETAGLSAGEIYFFTGPYAGELRLDDALGSWTGRESGDHFGAEMSSLDFDGDNALDVFAGTSWNQMGICPGGVVPAPHEPRPNCLLVDPVVGIPRHHTSDFDADGFDDLIIESEDGTLTGIFPGFAVPWDEPTFW